MDLIFAILLVIYHNEVIHNVIHPAESIALPLPTVADRKEGVIEIIRFEHFTLNFLPLIFKVFVEIKFTKLSTVCKFFNEETSSYRFSFLMELGDLNILDHLSISHINEMIHRVSYLYM